MPNKLSGAAQDAGPSAKLGKARFYFRMRSTFSSSLSKVRVEGTLEQTISFLFF